MYTVYLRTNTVNEMQYVGQTGNFKKRQWDWRSLTQNYANQYIDEDRLKYGLDSFTTQVLAEVDTEEEALELEEHYINELNTLYPQGYNISKGGKGRKAKHTEETKRKIGDANKGNHHTEETKHKIAEALKGEKHPLYGKHHSEEHKRKIGDANSKPVLQLDKTTGEVIKVWPSLREVERQLGYARTNISKCCLGKPNFNTAYGYKWRYA